MGFQNYKEFEMHDTVDQSEIIVAITLKLVSVEVKTNIWELQCKYSHCIE